MIPRSIEKFLKKYWRLDDINEELIEYNHYIVWYCGIDHIVDRTKTPEQVIIREKFYTYILDKTFKKGENVVIKYNDVTFMYYTVTNFINIYYDKQPFDMRIIKIPDGFSYLEFKLDSKYSFVYQQSWKLTDEELKDLELYTTKKTEEPRKVEFNEVFKKITIQSDMIL